MNNHINEISKLLGETRSFELINKYFEENKLPVKDRLLIIKEVMDVNISQASDIVLHKYRGELSDKLLDMFLNTEVKDGGESNILN